MRNIIYIICDSRFKAENKIKRKVKKIMGLTIEHKPIWVGVSSKSEYINPSTIVNNRRNEAYSKTFEAMLADNAGKEMVVMVRDDAMEVAKGLYEAIGTVSAGTGTLLNQALVRRTGSDVPPSYKLFKTPQGNYKSGIEASKALGIVRQVLGRWCNHNHKLIPEATRKSYPKLFNGYLTFKDAGFGRI